MRWVVSWILLLISGCVEIYTLTSKDSQQILKDKIQIISYSPDELTTAKLYSQATNFPGKIEIINNKAKTVLPGSDIGWIDNTRLVFVAADNQRLMVLENNIVKHLFTNPVRYTQLIIGDRGCDALIFYSEGAATRQIWLLDQQLKVTPLTERSIYGIAKFDTNCDLVFASQQLNKPTKVIKREKNKKKKTLLTVPMHTDIHDLAIINPDHIRLLTYDSRQKWQIIEFTNNTETIRTLPQDIYKARLVEKDIVLIKLGCEPYILNSQYNCNPTISARRDIINGTPVTRITSNITRHRHGTVLVNYGVYGSFISEEIISELEPLLDQGYEVIFAHIRGGGELGRGWHMAGIGTGKSDSVDDLINVARHVTTPVIGYTYSAGATILAAAVNKAPTLFSKIILTAPFLSPLQSSYSQITPLAITDRGEFGGLKDILQLDPTVNLNSGDATYPPALVFIGLRDKISPPEDAAAWLSRYPNARIIYDRTAAHEAIHSLAIKQTLIRRELSRACCKIQVEQVE